MECELSLALVKSTKKGWPSDDTLLPMLTTYRRSDCIKAIGSQSWTFGYPNAAQTGTEREGAFSKSASFAYPVLMRLYRLSTLYPYLQETLILLESLRSYLQKMLIVLIFRYPFIDPPSMLMPRSD